jgi:dipeptidyl aminopeptidase/acylaminoacyl peptidase
MRGPWTLLALIVAPLVPALVASPRLAPAQAAVAGQTPSIGTMALTVDSIMRGPELVGYPPASLRWTGDSTRLYFEWRLGAETEPATWVVPRAGGAPARLGDEERRAAPPPDGIWDRGRRRVIGVRDDDIVLVDSVAGSLRELTRTVAAEANPRWARGETHVTFTRDHNLFLVGLDEAAPGASSPSPVFVQLTDIARRKPEPTDTDSQAFLKQEERTLFETTARRASEREQKEKERKARQPVRLDLTERQSVVDIVLDAGERYAYALVNETAEGARIAKVPNYVTESAYTEEIETRLRVGDHQARRRLVVLDLEGRTTKWVTLEPAPAANTDETPVWWSWGIPVLSDDGRANVASARSSDNKEGLLVTIDPATATARVLVRQHDEAWVRWSLASGFGWVPESTTAWFTAERDGWMHLYSVGVGAVDARPRQLTSGRWEVTDVDVTPDRRAFLVTSTEEHPGERHVYRLGFGGGVRTKLTSRVGAHQVVIAPDGVRAAVVYSAANRPPELYLADLGGADLEQVTTSATEEWRAYRWVEPRLVTYAARDGAQVYARLYTPEMVGASRATGAPAVVFVHGAGYLQNAHRYWSSYYREYMFHHLLASRGYVVLDPDYRASAGYGRDWRTAIYRHMGGKDLEDVVDGARYLVAEHGVDAARIGVYGGSYGGFITLMAMFTTPDVFAAGAALRPVTDWAHYNHSYTSNILNQPQADVEAYRRSSPIYFAQNLRGALLICHGMVDTNVHFQDSIRLVQRLIELRKENWELAVYPVEDHGFVEATSWADEYKRILALFERTLPAPGGAVRTDGRGR